MRKIFALSLLALFFLACAQTKKPLALAPPQEEAPPPVPAVPVEFSLFEEHEASCLWNRLHLPGGELKTIAQFPFPCAGVELQWSADLTRAVVSFPPKPAPESKKGGAKGIAQAKAKAGPQAFAVEVATGALAPLEPPPKLRGKVRLFGISPEGIVALSLESSPKLEKALLQAIKKKKAKPFQLTGGGEEISIKLPGELPQGVPAVAHAWLLKDGTWTRIESKFVTTEWDYGFELAAYGQFGPSARRLLGVRSLPEAQALEDATLLAAWQPKGDEPWAPQEGDERARWGKQSTPHGELFVWMNAGEFDFITSRLLYQPKGGTLALLPGLGFAPEALAAVSIRETWLLVGEKDTGVLPRVYDLRSGELVWSSDSAQAVVFWPESPKAPSPEEVEAPSP